MVISSFWVGWPSMGLHHPNLIKCEKYLDLLQVIRLGNGCGVGVRWILVDEDLLLCMFGVNPFF